MRHLLKILIVAVLVFILSACNFLEYEVGNLKEELAGRTMLIQSYDEDSQLIDRIQGESISVNADRKFAIKDSEGNTVEKSSVLNITVGGKQMLHVGSSLLAFESGLSNLFEEYSQKVDIKNFDRSVPFLNRLVNDLQNATVGKSKIVLIRSQSGQPLATFAGDDVSYFATDIDKSTALLIDGKFLLIYRCDYTIYDTELLQ
ncbi:DUF5052 family protein [Lysinibacillus mangiferihumi]|uniref:DUF5052 family protein n=1 Tax=Lysinibacillus mangiferihumi TaxID=1130819 RepID=A0A4U2YIF5_9BACI|nr:DUF5052 family protein [Lysinibacillus mangiferihumi]TKI60082.1 DUF5052 family protein [Lysinibacillus mangiferihumi]